MILEAVNHLERFLLLAVDISFLGSFTIIIHGWFRSDCFRRQGRFHQIEEVKSEKEAMNNRLSFVVSSAKQGTASLYLAS